MTEELPHPLIDLIQAHLEGRGWRSQERPGIRWVDHRRSTLAGEARVRYLPGIDRLIADFQFDDRGATLALSFRADTLSDLLEVLCDRVPSLDLHSWSALIEALEQVTQEVRVIVDGVAVALADHADPLLQARTPGEASLAQLLLAADDEDDEGFDPADRSSG